MIAKSHNRNECRLCLNKTLVPSINLPVSPIADHYTSYANQKAERFPLDLYICTSCGHVQMTQVVRKDILFNNDYTYKPSNNSDLRNHFKSYGQLLVKALGSVPTKSLDIGSNDGLFLSVLKDAFNTNVLGIDPAKDPVSFAMQNGIDTIQDFFTLEKAYEIGSLYGKFDHVSANNVFAHNDDLNSFAEGVSYLLSDDGVFSFEISYLVDIVEKALIGTIFHEHLSHHSLTPMVEFLGKHGLYLFDAHKVDSQGGSLVCFASKNSSKAMTSELDLLLEYESENRVCSPEYMDRFRQILIALKSEFCHLLNECVSSDNRIIGYGASRSANFLVEFFQLNNILYTVLDDSEEKVGKFLPNTTTVIEKASEFKYQSGDVVIPLAWIHTDKIVEKLKSMTGKDSCVKALTFYPRLQYINLSK